MTGIRNGTAQPMGLSIGDATAVLQLDTTLYEVDAILRACYKYTDRCYLFLAREPEMEHLVNVYFMSKRQPDLATVLGEFCNELVDQNLRLTLSKEFGPIRELIVAQAFSEGNLLDAQRDEGDYAGDPLGIGERR
jgi:His-Xaa-Ser system protein HxsD